MYITSPNTLISVVLYTFTLLDLSAITRQNLTIPSIAHSGPTWAPAHFILSYYLPHPFRDQVLTVQLENEAQVQAIKGLGMVISNIEDFLK